MIAAELLAQVRRIEILTGRLVTETFAGRYLSAFKGRGMEFSEVREYAPGDDVRSMDWNVTARTGRPHVRRYAEERELTVMIACDLSGSQYFGSGRRLKREVAAELSALLAFSALRNNDKAGLLLFTDAVEAFVPPRKGRRHALALVRDVLAFEPRGRGTRLAAALETASRVLRRHCILFLISDFRDRGFERALRLAALRHDVIPIVVTDPREAELPAVGAYLDLEDPETGRPVTFDARDLASLPAAARREAERLGDLEALFTSCGLDSIRVSADRPLAEPVVDFFRRRERRLRR